MMKSTVHTSSSSSSDCKCKDLAEHGIMWRRWEEALPLPRTVVISSTPPMSAATPAGRSSAVSRRRYGQSPSGANYQQVLVEPADVAVAAAAGASSLTS